MRFPTPPRRTKFKRGQILTWCFFLSLLFYISAYFALFPESENKIQKRTDELERIESGTDHKGDIDDHLLEKVETHEDEDIDVSILTQEEMKLLAEIDYSGAEKFSSLPKHSVISREHLNSCANYSGRRNYTKDPVLILSNQCSAMGIEVWAECDCPCGFTGNTEYLYSADGFATVIPGGDTTGYKRCPHQYKILYSMESEANYPSLSRNHFKNDKDASFDILATTDLDSDVPAPYFSWEEYDFFRPLQQKTENSEMMVMISNCGGSNGRLNYIESMISAGLKVDSYGRCLHNRELPSKQGSHFMATKVSIQTKYLFSNVFENSNVKDYVTEKLFGSFVAGSVPVHMGIENHVNKFGPSPKSIISVHDFSSPNDLVQYLKFLASNETAYNEYLKWKTEGVSKEWRAMVDLSRVHSWCRLCIRIGDLNRWKNNWDEVFATENPYYEENMQSKKTAPQGSLFIKARERGKYWFKALYLENSKYDTLYNQIKSNFQGWIELFDIYRVKKHMWDTLQHYKEDSDMAMLQEGEEIEIVLLDRLKGSPSTKWGKFRKHVLEEHRKNNMKIV